jgi:hypothetical protein
MTNVGSASTMHGVLRDLRTDWEIQGDIMAELEHRSLTMCAQTMKSNSQ